MARESFEGLTAIWLYDQCHHGLTAIGRVRVDFLRLVLHSEEEQVDAMSKVFKAKGVTTLEAFCKVVPRDPEWDGILRDLSAAARRWMEGLIAEDPTAK
jgi:hypothetical protein